MLLYVHRNCRLIRDGSPGRPPRLLHFYVAGSPLVLFIVSFPRSDTCVCVFSLGFCCCFPPLVFVPELGVVNQHNL